jgi:hypothetical protein
MISLLILPSYQIYIQESGFFKRAFEATALDDLIPDAYIFCLNTKIDTNPIDIQLFPNSQSSRGKCPFMPFVVLFCQDLNFFSTLPVSLRLN